MSDAIRASDEQLRDMHAWWRAANYLSVGQIYLLDNPLLRVPLIALLSLMMSRRCTSPAPAMAVPAWWPTPGSTAPTARSIRA